MHTVKPEKIQEAVDFKEIETDSKETENTEEKGNCDNVD